MLEMRTRYQSSKKQTREEQIEEIRNWLRSLAEMEDPVKQFEIWELHRPD